MKRRLTQIAFWVCVVATLFTGCGEAKGKLYSKSQVKGHVQEEVPSEKYSLESVESMDDSSVSLEIYTFKSKERDLEFKVENTRTIVTYYTQLYGRVVHVFYADAVHELYQDSVDQIWANSQIKPDGNKVIISSFDDIKNLSIVLAKLNDCYRQELKYNTQEWLTDNPLADYAIRMDSTVEGWNQVSICEVEIDGSLDEKALYDYLTFSYASRVKEGVIEDETLTDDIVNKGHVSRIKSIMLADVNLSELSYQKAYDKHMINNTNEVYESGYCYALGDYVFPINVLCDEEYAPRMFEELLQKTGTYADLQASVVKNKEDEIESFEFIKGGKKISIDYVTCEDWTSPISATYVVGVRVSDLAELLGLSVTVNEEDGYVRFD